jgi:hypothetical protein
MFGRIVSFPLSRLVYLVLSIVWSQSRPPYGHRRRRRQSCANEPTLKGDSKNMVFSGVHIALRCNVYGVLVSIEL